MRLMHNTLLRGDVEKRIEMLAEAGQVPLAYVTARVYNISHMLNGPLEESLGQVAVAKLEDYISKLPPSTCLQPPCPLIAEGSAKDQNWPLKNLITSEYELRKNQSDPANPYAMSNLPVAESHNFSEEQVPGSAWGDKLDFDFQEPSAPGWGGTDFDVPDVPDVPSNANEANRAVIAGVPQQQKWARTCTVAGELVAAGAFSAAMQVLTRQAGVTDFVPLKQLFLHVHMSGKVEVPTIPHLSPIEFQASTPLGKPLVSITLSLLSHQLKEAYKLVNQAKFAESLDYFTRILQSILLLISLNSFTVSFKFQYKYLSLWITKASS